VRYLFFSTLIITAAAHAQLPRLAPDLQESLFENRPIPVIIYLAHQPGHRIALQVRQRHEPAIEEAAQTVRGLVRLTLPLIPLTREQERHFVPAHLSPDLEGVKHQQLQRIDDLQNEMATEIASQIAVAAEPSLRSVATRVRQLGGEVTGSTTIMSCVFATLPADRIAWLSYDPQVAWITLDHAGQPDLDVSAPSLGLSSGFWANGVTGGVQDAGVLDTGVQQNHPCFVGHTFESNGGTTDSDGHGTAMAGIMASRDTTYKGIAWGCDRICVAIAGVESASMSGMNYLMTGTVDRPENVNYSFGNGTATDTDYSAFDQFMDGVVDTWNVMVSKSAGNNGFGTTTITHPAPAYNLMASANMNDMNTLSRLDDRIASSSSRGPTLGGRKKPDIASPGTSIVSPTRTLGWAAISGTSPASPHTGGGNLLLRDLGLTTTMACKAVLINTADAWTDGGTQATTDDGPVPGSQWNKTYGWGYLNLNLAYLHGLDVFTKTLPAPVSGVREFKLFKGSVFANDKATLVWQRHVAFNGSSYPTTVRGLSNLDLAAYSQSSNALLASSASTIDNVEQVSVPAGDSVAYKVYTVGTFASGVATETFALATEENFAEATGPNLSVSFSHAASANAGQNLPMAVNVTNNGDLPAHNVTVSLGGISVQSGANPQNIGAIQPGQTVSANWTVQAQASPGSQPLTASASSSSYGEAWSGSAASSLDVTAASTPPDGMQVMRGHLISGGLADLLSSDDQYVRIRPGAVFANQQAPVEVVLEATLAVAAPSTLTFSLESAGSAVNLQQEIALLDTGTGTWVQLDQRPLPLSDAVADVTVLSGASAYVDAGTLKTKARVTCRQIGAIFAFPWHLRLDKASWIAVP
jgi:serine protease AprX